MPQVNTEFRRNYRLPGVQIGVSRSINPVVDVGVIVLLGVMTTSSGTNKAAGVAPINNAISVSDAAESERLFGAGSQMDLMVKAALRQQDFAGVWALPVAPTNGLTARADTVAFSGTPTDNGTAVVMVGNEVYQVAVASGSTAAVTATAFANIINSDTDAAVVASASGGTVTLTYKTEGTIMNDMLVSVDVSEIGGLSAVYTRVAGTGTQTYPNDIDDIMGDQEFDIIVNPDYQNAKPAINTALDVRWGQLSTGAGLSVACVKGAYTDLVDTAVTPVSDKWYEAVFGAEAEQRAASWELAAAAGSEMYQSALENPVAGYSRRDLTGIAAPGLSQRFSRNQRNALLVRNIANIQYKKDGTAQLGRVPATVDGVDIQETYVLQVDRRFYATLLDSLINRPIRDNDDPFVFNSVTPQQVEALCVSQYRRLASQGLVENVTAFARGCRAERVGKDRLKVSLPIDTGNALRQVLGVISWTN